MKKKIIIGLVAILVISTVVILNVVSANKTESGISVKTIEAKAQDISSYVSTSGIVQAEDSNLIYIEGDTRIGTVNVRAGDKVTKGLVLATVDVEELSRQLEQAKINLQMEQLQLKKLNANNKVKDTQQAEQNLQKAKNTYEYKKKEYENNKVLYDEGAIALSILEKSEMELDNASMEVESSNNQLQEIHKSNQETKQNLANEMAIQENKIKLVALKLEQLEKQFEMLKDNIISPIEGVVTQINIADGQYVQKGAAAFTITDINNLIVKVNVNEYDIGKVAIGQKVQITGNGLQHKKMYEGRVKSIASTAKKVRVGNAEETVIEVLIEIIDKDEFIKTGFSATVKIITEQANDAIVVPYEVLKKIDDEKKAIYVVRDGVAKEIEVETGIEADLYVQIQGDIQPGEQVISTPSDRIKDEVAVKIIENNKSK